MYKLKSRSKRFEFKPDGEPTGAYLLLRPWGNDFTERAEELRAAARVQLNLADGADLPAHLEARAYRLAHLGTVVVGWGGWQAENGKALESVPGALDPDDFIAILGDEEVWLWLNGAMRDLLKQVAEAFAVAEGNSEAPPAGLAVTAPN
jgi:hypothetical protein